MESFDDCFNNFISERIEIRHYKLKENKEYIENNEKFSRMKHEFLKTLSFEQEKTIEDLLECVYSINWLEMIHTYKMGFSDCISLNNYGKN